MPKRYFTGPNRASVECHKEHYDGRRGTPVGDCNCTNCRNQGISFVTLSCRGSRSCKCSECKKSKFLGIIGRGDIAALVPLAKQNPELIYSSTGVSPLLYAIRKNRPVIVKFLVEQGADTLLPCYAHRGEEHTVLLPVFYAALHQSSIPPFESAIALVDTADLTLAIPRQLGGGGVWTGVLRNCWEYSHGNRINEELVVELLHLITKRKSAGDPCPDIDQLDDAGITALRLASERHLVNTANFLLQKGANPYTAVANSHALVRKFGSANHWYATPMKGLLEKVFKLGNVALRHSRSRPIALLSLARRYGDLPVMRKIGKYTWKHILGFAVEARCRTEAFQFPLTDFERTAALAAIHVGLQPPPLSRSHKNLYTNNPML